MPARSIRGSWIRRTVLGCALLIAVLVTALLSLPWLVSRGFRVGAEALGGEEASIRVERADLSGIRATALAFRRGGLRIELAQASGSYSLRSLFDGRVHDVAIDGLHVDLDFRRPRRGLLPDAIEEILAQFGGGGELVWPVDTLTLANCRITLILPQGTETFLISGTAERRPDGRVAFQFSASEPRHELQLHGAVRTETMDGDLAIDRLSLTPGALLDLLQRLGVATLPTEISVDADRIEASVTARLLAGAVDSFDLQLRASALAVTAGSGRTSITDLTVRASRDDTRTPTATLQATVAWRGANEDWDLAPGRLHAALSGSDVRAELAPTQLQLGDTLRARGGMNLRGGIPMLGGKAHAVLDLSLAELEAAGRRFAELNASLEGWTDHLTLALPRLALEDPFPLELAETRVEIQAPLSDAPVAKGTLGIRVTPAVDALLPGGWSLTQPMLPATVARLDCEVTRGTDGLSAQLDLRSTLEDLGLTDGKLVLSSRPTLAVTSRMTSTGAACQVNLDLDSVVATGTADTPWPEQASLRIELPVTPYSALSALAERKTADSDLALTVAAQISAGPQKANASLALTRNARTRSWRAELEAALEAIASTFAGWKLEGLNGALAVDTGAVPDAVVQRMLVGGELPAAVDAVLPHARAELTLSAAALERSSAARAEWLDVRFSKPPARPAGPACEATLTARAGILRAHPEIVEQPELVVQYSGDLSSGTATGTLTGLLEGAPLTLEWHQALRVQGSGMAAEGTFTVRPFSLTNSDIVSRWSPDLKGTVISGTIAGEGTTRLDASGVWDGTARVTLTNGICVYPAQAVRAEGIFADVQVESLSRMRTKPTQRIGFTTLAVNDLEATDGLLQFRADSDSVVHIESAGLRLFDGRVTAEPFSLYFPDPDVALDLRMKDLDAGALVRTFDLFNGSLSGKLQGRLPIGLLAGRPIIGEGFLELQSEYPARLAFDTGGLFTSGLPNKTILEQINRIPHELIEEGLMNLQLRHFRIDLFRRDRPDQPVEIQLGGVARTRRTDVPLELTVRLNGSLSEVLDFLLQLVLL